MAAPAAPASFVMPAGTTVAGSPTVTSSVVMPTAGVTYAAPSVGVTYAVGAMPAATSYALPVGGVTYAAAPITNYSAEPTVTYASPMTYAAAPQVHQLIVGQPEMPELASTPVPAVNAASLASEAHVPTASVARALAAPTPVGGTDQIQFLSESPLTVQAERVPNKKAGKEAFATLPIELVGTVPDTFKPGDQIVFNGPDGDITVDSPANTQPGATVRYSLKPSPELRIQVPPGRQPGELVQFRRADGLEIEVPVPPGVKEGEYFDADPPAVMVRVPENMKAGEAVVFRSLRRDGQTVSEWCRALIPEDVAPGKFFTARLPPPVKPTEGDDDDDESSGSESEPESPKEEKETKKKAPAGKRKEKGCC